MRKIYNGVTLPNPGTKAWQKEVTKALLVPGFKITLSDRITKPVEAIYQEDKLLNTAKQFLIENVKG
jgi:hypothetical protein